MSARKWASFDHDTPVADPSAWVHDNIDDGGINYSSARGGASSSSTSGHAPRNSAGWAGLGNGADDSDADVEPQASERQLQRIPERSEVQDDTAAICESTTLSSLQNTINKLSIILKDSDEVDACA